MRGHLLHMLQLGLGNFKIGGDTGPPKGVIADARHLDPGLLRTALDHRPSALPVETSRAELPGLAVHGAEEGRILFEAPVRIDVLPDQGR